MTDPETARECEHANFRTYFTAAWYSGELKRLADCKACPELWPSECRAIAGHLDDYVALVEATRRFAAQAAGQPYDPLSALYAYQEMHRLIWPEDEPSDLAAAADHDGYSPEQVIGG